MTETKPETFSGWALHAARLLAKMDQERQMHAFTSLYLISEGHRAEFPSMAGAPSDGLPVGFVDVSLSHGRPRLTLNLDNPQATRLHGKKEIPVYLRPPKV